MRAGGLYVALSFFALAIVPGSSGAEISPKCEPITIPVCVDVPYNSTIYPNILGHTKQDESISEITQYVPLIKVNCSADISLFLCSIFAPVCTIMERPLPPCRSLCESARKCESLMKSFGYPWPETFECSKFPVEDALDDPCFGQSNAGGFDQTSLERLRTTTAVPGRPSDFSSMMNFICPAALKTPVELEYKLHFGNENLVVENCGAPCYKLFFEQSDISLVRTLVGIGAIILFISCSFTLATFCIDTARFPYPEKPIIFLTFCYFMVSIVLIIGFASGDSIACNQPFSSTTINLAAERLLKQGTLHDWRCSVLGMLFYFFLMSGSLWWFISALTWYLSAGLQWGQEAIDVKAAYLHGIVWTVASIQTTAVLILKKIEGDILTGTCFVGILDSTGSLLVFVPLALYMTLGVLFLAMGLVSLVRIRSMINRDGITKTDKLEKLIGKIGIFSMLYSVPAGCMLGCFIFEYLNMSDWMSLWQEDVCRHPDLSASWQVPCRWPDGHSLNYKRPTRFLFLIKYLSIIMIGIFSSTWVWSRKTFTTWKMFYRRLCGLPADGSVPTGHSQVHL